MRFPELGAIPPGPARYEHARAHVFAGALALDVVDDLTRLIERWRPDVVVRDVRRARRLPRRRAVRHPACHGAHRLRERLYSERHVVADSLDAVRARIGLSPDPDAERPFHHLQLSAAPPIMDDPAAGASADVAPRAPHRRAERRQRGQAALARRARGARPGRVRHARHRPQRTRPAGGDHRRHGHRADRAGRHDRPRRPGVARAAARRTSTSPAGSPRPTCSVAATPS